MAGVQAAALAGRRHEVINVNSNMVTDPDTATKITEPL